MRTATPLSQRFYSKFEIDPDNPYEGCWQWVGAKDRKGYGTISGERRNGQRGPTLRAPRAAYELLVGPIPAGLVIDHLCRNPACVNPAHLEPVTNWENLNRGTGPHYRHKTHCPQGHPYDEENTRLDKYGKRYCRTCQRDHDAKYRAKKRALREQT